MAFFVGAAPILAPAIPMVGPFNGSYGVKLKEPLSTLRVVMVRKYGKAECDFSLFCSPRKPISAVALSRSDKFGSSLELDKFLSRGFAFSRLPCHHRPIRTIVSRASNDDGKNNSHFPSDDNLKEDKMFIPLPLTPKLEKKPKWWWRTLACIPYLVPLHMMSLYANGAHRFLPFLANFEYLADPIFGNVLPSWFLCVYCMAVYFLVVRRKELPHFFRFHVIMALLLENAVQVIGIVVGFMPYWRNLDTPFWTVVACGLLIAMIDCIRWALKGTYANTPFFSEAAMIHTYMP